MSLRARVLIVEDNDDFAALLATLIESHPALDLAGRETTLLGATLRTLRYSHLDAALVDFHLAGDADGDAVIELLRAEYPEMIIVGLTAEHDPDVHRRMLDAGANAVHEKREIVAVLLDGVLLAEKER